MKNIFLKKSILFLTVFLISCFFVFALPNYSQAAIYYVDKENKFGNNCSNAWAGTVAQPKCDFNHDWFWRNLDPGDEVIVREAPAVGYGEMRLYVESSGNAQNPILIHAYENEHINLAMSLQFGVRLVSDVSYITFEDLSITNREYSFATDGVQTNGNYGIKLHDCDIFNTLHGPRWFNYHDSEIKNCEIHDISTNGLQFRYSTNILLDHVNVARVDDGRSPDNSDADGFHTYGSENLIISNSSSSYNAEDGFDLNANATLINVHAHHNNGGGLKIWRRVEDNYAEKTVTVINSIFNNNGYYAPEPAQGNPGVKVSYGAKLEMYNSVVFGNYDQGIKIRWAADDGAYLADEIYPTSIIKNTIISDTINGPGLEDTYRCMSDTRNLQESPHCASTAHLTTESNNLYFNNFGGNAKGYNLSGVYGDFILTNSVTTNPLFVDAVIGDFQLASGSGAIAAGLDLGVLSNPYLAYDLNGILRPQGFAWDIGAYKYEEENTDPPADPRGLNVN